MNALEALGYMAVTDSIIQIRNIKPSVILVKDEILKEGGNGLLLLQPEIVSNAWELGYKCTQCGGTGVIGYGHSIDPDYKEVPCVCENGILWQDEY